MVAISYRLPQSQNAWILGLGSRVVRLSFTPNNLWDNFQFLLCNLGLCEFGGSSAQGNKVMVPLNWDLRLPLAILPSHHAESTAKEGGLYPGSGN